MDSALSLCAPDGLKACFACCPPIRPAGYEHIQYRNAIQRVLRENTRDFERRIKGPSQITGFSCWALGYLDDAYQRIGCLLHPEQNRGADLRDRTGFGDKCRRETCVEGKIFQNLDPSDRRFWLPLAEGLDSFSYSSRATNPLFRVLGWGAEILSAIAREDAGRTIARESFGRRYPLLATHLSPRANAYLLQRVVNQRGIGCLRDEGFQGMFERLAERLKADFPQRGACSDGIPPTHFLTLEPSFLNYIRLSLGLKRVRETEALDIKQRVDRAVDEFVSSNIESTWAAKSPLAPLQVRRGSSSLF